MDPHPAQSNSLFRVWQRTRNSNIGVITAFRKDATQQSNRASSAVLAADTHGRFGYLKVRPRFTECDDNVHEESLLVIGSARNDSGNLLGYLRQQGQRFGQDRFVFKRYDDDNAYLLSASAAFPAHREMHKVGLWHPNQMAEYHELFFPVKGSQTKLSVRPDKQVSDFLLREASFRVSKRSSRGPIPLAREPIKGSRDAVREPRPFGGSKRARPAPPNLCEYTRASGSLLECRRAPSVVAG